jgi:hypothetical protein
VLPARRQSGGALTTATRDLRDLIPSSIVKITLSCNLMKTQSEISWLGLRDDFRKGGDRLVKLVDRTPRRFNQLAGRPRRRVWALS